MSNENLVLVGGKSATGKSACLRNIKIPTGVMYLNCENNKKLPFKSGFAEYTIIDPLQVYEAMDVAETKPDIHTIIIDSSTYLMDMYETKYVLTSPNTMKAWGEYAQFWKRFMSHYVAKSTKNIIVTGHTMDIHNEKEMSIETMVKFKGSIMNTGVESYFSTVIATKKMTTVALEAYKSPMLTITPEEEALGFKYVFQVKLTKETVDERIRSSLGMWTTDETFIDNDIQNVLDRLHDYYS